MPSRPGDMADASPLTIRPSEAQKRDWKEFVEQSGDVRSLNGLILRAVENEIEEEKRGIDPREVLDMIREIDDDVSTLNREMGELVDTLNELDKTLNEVRKQTVVKNKLLRIIPEGKGNAMTVDELGMAVDESTRVVSRILEQAVWEFDYIDQTRINEQVAYYR